MRDEPQEGPALGEPLLQGIPLEVIGEGSLWRGLGTAKD